MSITIGGNTTNIIGCSNHQIAYAKVGFYRWMKVFWAKNNYYDDTFYFYEADRVKEKTFSVSESFFLNRITFMSLERYLTHMTGKRQSYSSGEVLHCTRIVNNSLFQYLVLQHNNL